jgi:hypothetical protein
MELVVGEGKRRGLGVWVADGIGDVVRALLTDVAGQMEW